MSRLLDFGEIVGMDAYLYPDKIGARDLGRALTFRDWNERSCKLANALLGLGLEKGDRIAVLAHNCLESMEIYAAVAKAGLVMVPINFRLVGPEVQYIVENSEAKAVIVQDDLLDCLETIRAEGLIAEDKHIHFGGRTPAGYRSYEEMVAAGASSEPSIESGPRDPYALLYTSGTTGKPKGGRAGDGRHRRRRRRWSITGVPVMPSGCVAARLRGAHGWWGKALLPVILPSRSVTPAASNLAGPRRKRQGAGRNAEAGDGPSPWRCRPLRRRGEVMAVGEGIETMLSLRCVMPTMPMVAALSAAHLAAIQLPATLRRLYIARDDDPAGNSAMASLPRRRVGRLSAARVPPARIPDARRGPTRHPQDAARTCLGFRFRSEDQHRRDAYQPVARQDRPRRPLADSDRTRRRTHVRDPNPAA